VPIDGISARTLSRRLPTLMCICPTETTADEMYGMLDILSCSHSASTPDVSRLATAKEACRHAYCLQLLSGFELARAYSETEYPASDFMTDGASTFRTEVGEDVSLDMRVRLPIRLAS
jgi:hypothetical protein